VCVWNSFWLTAPLMALRGQSILRTAKLIRAPGQFESPDYSPNPGNILRPGGYGKVRAVVRIQQDALLVPQRAVSELQGGYQVAAIDGENKVSIRAVQVGDRVGTNWIVTDGLKRGDRVVAEGVQKVRPGMQVNPKPFAGESQGR